MNIPYRNDWLKYCCLKWIEGNYSALPKGRVETTHKSLPLLRYWNSRKYRSNDTWMAIDVVSLALDDRRKMDIITFCMRHENETNLRIHSFQTLMNWEQTCGGFFVSSKTIRLLKPWHEDYSEPCRDPKKHVKRPMLRWYPNFLGLIQNWSHPLWK